MEFAKDVEIQIPEFQTLLSCFRMGESQYYVLCSTCILTRFVVNQVGKIVNNEVGTYFLVRSPKLYREKKGTIRIKEIKSAEDI